MYVEPCPVQVQLVLSRAKYWFWDSVVLWQTLALAAAQVLTVSLDAYFQLIIMLTLLVLGFALLSHLRPFTAPLSQTMQVTSSYWGSNPAVSHQTVYTTV